MEALGLQRAWRGEEEGSIRFPDTKSGAQTPVIGDAAIKVLVGQPHIGKPPFFFPADRGDGHFIGLVRVLDRVCAMVKLEDVTPHTLRDTFASVAAELGFSELTVAALLRHAARGETQRSIHIEEALMITSDKVAEEIADLLDGRAPAPWRRVRRAELAERPLEVMAAADEQR
jgi:integrase